MEMTTKMFLYNPEVAGYGNISKHFSFKRTKMSHIC